MQVFLSKSRLDILAALGFCGFVYIRTTTVLVFTYTGLGTILRAGTPGRTRPSFLTRGNILAALGFCGFVYIRTTTVLVFTYTGLNTIRSTNTPTTTHPFSITSTIILVSHSPTRV